MNLCISPYISVPKCILLRLQLKLERISVQCAVSGADGNEASLKGILS